MKYRFLILLLVLLIPVNIQAKELIYAECKKNNAEYECKISGNFDYPISALDFHFSLPANASVTKYNINDEWQGTIENDWITLYSDKDSINEFEIATINIKSEKKITGKDIEFHDILVYDEDFSEHKIAIKDEKSQKNNTKILLIVIICGIIILSMIVMVLKVKKGDSK